MKAILENEFTILFTGTKGFIAHEMIIDLKSFKKEKGITVEHIAKRLMDYGFHAPTIAWPIPDSMMIEPTESESKREMDRFCNAMISIRQEIQDVIDGTMDANDNPLKNAPHTASVVTVDEWKHSYSRQIAAFPAPWLKEHKYWPTVGRIDNAFGDRNLVCTCPPIDSYEN